MPSQKVTQPLRCLERHGFTVGSRLIPER